MLKRVSAFDLPGTLRRVRRIADLSQRELAARIGVSAQTIGHVETGRRDLMVSVLARVAELAGLRIALVDQAGNEVDPMAADTARDGANRRFPAHLDTRYGDEDWWHGEERYAREQPWYTFDRLRYTRDYWRGRTGTPDDHLIPRPDDSPAARRAARIREARREVRPTPEWICTCPPECEELDDRSARPVHAAGCPCSCDVG